ncbi:phage tail-collar fiber domain-containing protein [Salmonella enterica]|uniref:phage tail-collar fiber domain-containing protein n=1 Tax=Salmonella enterica TaxID=28901 RepID=UPI0009ABD1C1|nr:phage tail protein [Salmonella enterica]
MPAGLTLTTAGAAEIESAYQAGSVVTIKEVAIGDGGGLPPPSTPDELAAMTTLNGEFGREPFADGSAEEGFLSGQIVIDCKTYPGKTLREVGLVSQAGTLMAYGLYPDTFLPDQTDSVIKEVILTLVLGLTHAENVTLELDPQRMIITQDSGDKRYLRISEDLAEIAEKGEAAQARGRGHLGVYGQEESDSRFQPKGDYTPAGEAYTKQESDDRFQPKGNYTPAGEAYTKAESDNRFQAKGECYTKNQSDARYVQDEQLGAQSSIWTAPGSDTFVPAGCTQTGVHLSGDGSTGTHVEFLFYKPVQIYINGAWRTING